MKAKLIAVMSKIEKGSNLALNATVLLSALAIITSCVIVTWSVIARGVGIETYWQMEASVYLLIFATFIGAGYTHVTGGQIGVSFLKDKLKGKWAFCYDICISVCTIVLFGLFFYSGVELFLQSWDGNWKSETLWGPPLWIVYLIIPVGSAQLIASVLVNMIARFVK